LSLKSNKMLASLLIVAILILSINVNIVNAADAPNYSALRNIHKRPDSITYTTILASIKNISDATGTPEQNINNEWLNPFVYADYKHIVVYGQPSGDFYKVNTGKMNNNGSNGEYKYLGENKDGDLVTNDHYYNTGSSGKTFSSVEEYKAIEWQNISGALKTWTRNITPEQVKQLAYTNFTDDDYVTQGEVPLTLKELLGDNLYNQAYVQVQPSMWSVTGSVRLEYDGSNWNTVTIPPSYNSATFTKYNS